MITLTRMVNDTGVPQVLPFLAPFFSKRDSYWDDRMIVFLYIPSLSFVTSLSASTNRKEMYEHMLYLSFNRYICKYIRAEREILITKSRRLKSRSSQSIFYELKKAERKRIWSYSRVLRKRNDIYLYIYICVYVCLWIEYNKVNNII